MINFMCHEHLTIKIGPLINFIIGHNGSGKSAALTALTISLGGKANATNRGASLKSFIQNGKDQATLIVKLKNAGGTGYRSDEYGDSIIVERQFSRAGTSGFKIKSQAGRIISTKKSDVDDVMDYFGLQMDNPLTILTQDMARQFLSNSTPAQKYTFFIRGVQLEQLEQDYSLIEEQLEILDTTFEEREAFVAQLDQELQKAKDNYRATGRLREFREKLELYRMKMVWCQVATQERKQEALRKDLDKLQAEIQAAHEEAEMAGQLFEEADTAKEYLSTLLRAAEDALNPILEQVENAKAAHDRLMKESSDLQHDHRVARDSVKNSKQKIIKKQNDIADEERRLEEKNGGSYAERVRELESQKTAAKAASDSVKEHAEAEIGLKSAIAESEAAQTRHKNARGPLQSQVTDTERRLQELRSNSSRHDVYGPKMPQLLKAIQHDSGFRVKPIGPLGNHVQLRKPTWSSILEKFFGNSLNGFVVSSKEDQERLTGTMRRMGCSFPVSIVREGVIDYRNHEAGQDFATVLRVLNIEHPAITKYMIINHNIEQVILIEDMKEARDIMFGPRIPNVKACFSLAHDDSTNGERYAYSMTGVATSYAEGYRGKSRMKAPTKDHIDHEEKVLHQQRQTLHEHDDRFLVLRNDLEQAKKALIRHKRENADLKARSILAADELEQFKSRLEQDMPQQGRLDQLKQELVTLESDKTKHEESFGLCVVSLDTIKAKRAADLQAMKDGERLSEEANTKVEEASTKLKDADTARANALIMKNEIHAAVEIKETERDNPENGLLAAIANVKRLITDWITKASDYGPRVPIANSENMESMKALFDKTQKNIELQEQKLGGSIVQLLAAYEEAKAKHESAVRLLEDDKELRHILLTTLDSRRKRWKLFQSSITTRARLGFEYLLSNRGFRGKLRVNHRDKHLDVEIQPDETQAGKGRRAAKTLSGGEKSFAQICLIVALWEAIGAPIRCLDEFDVFMDSVNRDLAMKILIEAARNSHGRQFILITPQSMSSLADGPDIKVHK